MPAESVPVANQERVAAHARKQNGKINTNWLCLDEIENAREGIWYAQVVEQVTLRGNARVSRDLLGFIDILALRTSPDPGITLGIQTTTGSHHAEHRKKICHDCAPQALAWLRAGNLIQIWSWTQNAGGLWCLRVDPIHAGDIF